MYSLYVKFCFQDQNVLDLEKHTDKKCETKKILFVKKSDQLHLIGISII